MAVTEEQMAKPRFVGCNLSEEEFLALPDDGHKYELVNGEAKEVPTGARHGRLGMRLGRLLGPFVDPVGELFDSSTGFRMANGNVRSPDVSYVSRERLPGGEAPVGFLDGAPDLCIEIISPSEDKADMGVKVGEYLESGAKQVWQLFPESGRIVVYRSLDNVQSYGADEELDAGDIVPGFRCRVGELFAIASRPTSS